MSSQENQEQKKTDKELEAKAKADLKNKLATERANRDYVPEAGTGKHFHALIEVVQHSKTGKKVSITKPSVQSFETFLAWVKQAARLGYSFGMAHDPYRFYSKEVMDQVKEAVKGYVKAANIENLEYAVNKLTSGDGVVNKWLKEFYKKRVAHIASEAKKAAKKDDYLD